MSNVELFLFSTDDATVAESDAGGVAGFIVDWEHKGKAGRQDGYDTQVNQNTPDDIQRLRALTHKRILCRVNNAHTPVPERNAEIETAIDHGADEILLPMVRSAGEVEEVLAYIDGRCPLGVLIETCDAVARAGEIGALPLSRVYVGLNDLAIDRKQRNIFRALQDGTVDAIRRQVQAPFGFAGLTLPELGYPIPCRLLMSEMVRLRCSFTFLRRTFLADTRDKDIRLELPRMKSALDTAFGCSEYDLEEHRLAVNEAIHHSEYFFNSYQSVFRESPADV